MTDTVDTPEVRPRPAALSGFAEWVGARYGDLPALREKGAGPVSYARFRERVREAGRGLMAAGVSAGDRVGILGETCADWTYAHFAVLAVGGVVVPVYPTAGDDEVAWVLGDSGAALVLCQTASQAERVRAVTGAPAEGAGGSGAGASPEGVGGTGVGAGASPERAGGTRVGRGRSGVGPERGGRPLARPSRPRGAAPPPKEAGRAEGVAPPPKGAGRAEGVGRLGEGAGVGGGVRTVLLGELVGLPVHGVTVEDFLGRGEGVRAEDLASIVYTSGTTGPPKGCRLTHANFAAVLDGGAEMIRGGPGDVTYLYLPLAHLLAQLIELNTLMFGGELCYFGGRIEDVIGELAEVRPTHLPSVPRFFEKVHATVLGLAEAQEGGRERFEEAVRIGVLAAEGRLPESDREAYEAAEESLYGLVRAAFGGRVRWALTGAAPIAPQTLDFLRACGIPVYEGYGMTESGGVISLNRPGAVRYGSVGRAYPGCEIRIAEGDGEVLARGGMVFPGYEGNADASREVLDADGWLHTGDLGVLDEDGYLTITGRKKDLIITSAGKNLTPSLVEHAVQQSRYVSYAVMAGDRRPHPVALITLDAEEIAAWAAREGHELGERPGRHPAVRELVREAVEAANAQVSRPARLRAFAVLDEDLSIADGTLTPTLKVRRKAVLERYAAEIEELYR
ncbi:AMP-dependent synthetase/ligase [Streptomyces sp. NBC_00237]|uniref:AMP-dependent synthetase/ligase n=1 Tax=Streptomyces sp. NBC_00237 TaxID=2975687 RepID=UPI002252B7C1|nr:AMP-dependent synthetase/ligase [Streptomyces sp. NBC_00237]MCX5204965.1 AMP-dependent synthetase/ligase [Streptomyces sp. NBC_00237]